MNRIVSLILMVAALFVLPALGQDCVTDAYGNKMCGVGHYVGLSFDGNDTSILVAGENIALVDQNNNTIGIGAPLIGILANSTEHTYSVKTYEEGSWNNYLRSSFESDTAGPITITGNNLTVLDIGMNMPDTFKYTVDFSKHEAYIDLV